LDQVRKSEYGRLAGRDRRYIKGQKYTLLSRRENLTLDGKKALKTLLAANKRADCVFRRLGANVRLGDFVSKREFMLDRPKSRYFPSCAICRIADRRHDRATPRPVRKTADGTSNQRSAAISATGSSKEVLRVLKPLGINAAVKAIAAQTSETTAAQRQLELSLQQARYEAAHARRQYDPSIPPIASWPASWSAAGTRRCRPYTQ
jgi:hypothetical protein